MATVQTSSPPGIEFTKLNPYVSIYIPSPSTSASASASAPEGPSIILICQWMGASPRSRALQTLYQRYAALYPSARIVTMRSVPAFFMTMGTAARLGYFEPVVDALASVVGGGETGSGSGNGNGSGSERIHGKVLFHAFSNGGGLTLWDVCSLWKARQQKQHGDRKVLTNGEDGQVGDALRIDAVVLDSTPGDPTIVEGWEAMKVGLPGGLMWWFGAASIWALIGWLWTWKSLLGRTTLIDQMRDGLNNEEVVDKRAKRLYVYSTADKLVNFKGVEQHIAKARELGIDVTTLKEEGISHVQHMIKDEERYWRKIEELWQSTRR